jgi:hypothetical protein
MKDVNYEIFLFENLSFSIELNWNFTFLLYTIPIAIVHRSSIGHVISYNSRIEVYENIWMLKASS